MMMDEQNALIEFARRWNNMNASHIEQRVKLWDGNYGLFFVGPDDRTSEATEFLLDYLQPDAVLKYDEQTQAQWRKETEVLFEKQRQQNLLDPLPKRVCIVTKLDSGSDWLFGRLKFIFENAIRPTILLATATAPETTPDYLASHYHIFHASAIRRKVSAAYKELPDCSTKSNTKPEITG